MTMGLAGKGQGGRDIPAWVGAVALHCLQPLRIWEPDCFIQVVGKGHRSLFGDTSGSLKDASCKEAVLLEYCSGYSWLLLLA